MDFIFEFGGTKEVEAFLNRHANIGPPVEMLQDLINTCFAREKPQSRDERVLFSLGESCREDFLEILFLGSNGYGSGASKLLRGLFERSLALAYMTKVPTKVERFIDFTAVQEYKALQSALRVANESQWDQRATQHNSAAEIRRRFEAVKNEFLQTDCKKCGTRKLAIGWDLDIASMVREVGSPYDVYYPIAYTGANFQVHATLASALREDNMGQKARQELRRKDCDGAVFCAALLMLEVISSQNRLFDLGLDDLTAPVSEAIGTLWNGSVRDE